MLAYQSFNFDLLGGFGVLFLSEILLLSTHQTDQPVIFHFGVSFVSAAPDISHVLSV